MNVRLTAAAAVLMAPLAIAASALAADVQSDRVVYEAAFFKGFAPQTALDMVARLPGFSLTEGDERRGFAGAGGNVLIDGQRPSAKSQSLSDALSQIPAGRVLRIEVLRNAGGDAQGQALVANVVRASATGGVWRLEAAHSSDGRVSPRGDASYSTRALGAELKIGASRYMEQSPLSGWRDLRDGTFALTGRRWDETPRTYREARINGEAKFKALDGDVRLNASGGRWNFQTGLLSKGFAPAGALSDLFTFDINERRRSREIGGDWARSFGATKVKIVGLDTRYWYANDERTRVVDPLDAPASLTSQKRRNVGSESIGRFVATRTFGSHALEAGAETARNQLDADVDLAIDGAPIALPAGDVTVAEDRAEAYLADIWTLTPRWTLETRLARETSTITQSGDTNAEASFSFLKPSIQLSRKFGDRNQARVKLYRDVGQLEFGDFASSAALGDDRVAAGNPGLKPDSRWRLEAAVDARFGAQGALSATLFHEKISDARDVVPVDGFDAPGNIGEGRLTGLSLTATAPLTRLASGLVLTLDGTWRAGSVTDPLTQREREPTTTPAYFYTLELRRDDRPRKLAYGLRYEKQAEFQFYRIGEIETYEEQGELKAYVDATWFKSAKVSLYADNLLNRRFHRERRFFAPDRRGALAFAETRDRQLGRLYGIEISGAF